MYFAAVVVMSTLERVRMEFNCYDVLEVHGSRYVITEKIKYIEIIPKKQIRNNPIGASRL